jgi:Tfp pilus assembly protein PilF
MKMSRRALLLVLVAVLSPWCLAQTSVEGSGRGQAPATVAPPRSDEGPIQPNESSSKQTEVDLSPPANDYGHEGADISDVTEFKKYDPHRAAKDMEVANYYARQGNYRAALWRYQDALDYKPNDPDATYMLADTFEHLQQPRSAARYTVLYLRLAPNGHYADEAKKLQAKLRPEILALATTPEKKRAFQLVDEGTEALGGHDFHQAIAKLQEALQNDPQDQDAMFFLASAYEQNGQMDEASAAYRAYLRMDRDGVFAESARVALQHLPALRGEGVPVKPGLPTSLPSETPR